MGGALLVVAIVAAAVAGGAVMVSRPRVARASMVVSAAALVGALSRLAWAIAKLDFSFVYVAQQSRARSSGAYRFAAIWGGAEGSLLLFCTLLALVFTFGVWRADLAGWGIAVPAAVVAAMTAAVVLFADPFTIAELPPVRGAGLTPILEHPAMLYHPPILYLGLVSTVIPFAVAVGAADPLSGAALANARRWLLIAWTLLTVGLATGANWAYVELGWGGYWAWDPVENTVLMPWLVLTAGVHMTRSPRLLQQFPRSSLALVLTPFLLVAFGTAVTRSGGLSSVHAFAEARALGWALGLVVAALAAIVSVRIARWTSRPTRLTAAPRDTAPRDTGLRDTGLRETGLGVSVVIAVFMTVVVLMGVVVPILPGSNRIVTALFYNRVGTPVLLLALLAMMAVPSLMTRQKSTVAFAALGGCAAVGLAILFGVHVWLSLIVIGLGAAIVLGHAAQARSIPVATLIGHIGFVVVALGIAGSAQSSVTSVVLTPGESQSFGSDLTLTYESFLVTDGPRPQSEAITVTATVTDAGRDPITLTPGLISYPDRGVVLAETALHSTPRRDVQVVVRAISDDGLASFDLSERPAQMLVWWGSVLIAIAGATAIATMGQSSAARRLRASNASSVDVDPPPESLSEPSPASVAEGS